MKIGIAGYGYVGKAHELMLEPYHDIIISDPAQGHYGDLRHADAIIICVSTPGSSNGHCDVTNVGDVLDDGPNVPYLIKSTMSIEGWKLVTDCCKNKNVSYSPEFLRAAHWKTDFRLNDHMYVGGGDTNFWAELFIDALGSISVTPADPKELIAAKQLRNSFLALKVTYFNQVKDFCDAQEIDFETVRKVITDDKRINASHSLVSRNARGYGGHCFPKDVTATIRSAQVAGGRITILEEADNYNQQVRKDPT
jgi:UDPglucose 6-dehydrogenase|tara:strand:- start:249 stop:1004 length:756 start_codon:yes stop_codon:yes gene_type:complete